MWCAARHCAFESHPLRHKTLDSMEFSVFLYFPLARGIPLRYDKKVSEIQEREGGSSRPAVTEYEERRSGIVL